jgi:hypothetical protein
MYRLIMAKDLLVGMNNNGMQGKGKDNKGLMSHLYHQESS